MTAEQVTVQRALLEQVLCHIVTGSPEWDIDVLVDTLRTALEQPGVEPEIHDAKCPALDGGACGCAESRSFIDKPWARFCGAFGRGPDAPYPGMIEAFEAHYSQSFTDREWHNETAVWAAAWKKAKAHQPPQPQQPAVEPVAWWKQYPDGNVSVVEGKVFLTEDALYRGWVPLGFVDAAPVQEPVAWRMPIADGTWRYSSSKPHITTDLQCQPLYISPQPQKPGVQQCEDGDHDYLLYDGVYKCRYCGKSVESKT